MSSSPSSTFEIENIDDTASSSVLGPTEGNVAIPRLKRTKTIRPRVPLFNEEALSLEQTQLDEDPLELPPPTNRRKRCTRPSDQEQQEEEEVEAAPKKVKKTRRIRPSASPEPVESMGNLANAAVLEIKFPEEDRPFAEKLTHFIQITEKKFMALPSGTHAIYTRAGYEGAPRKSVYCVLQEALSETTRSVRPYKPFGKITQWEVKTHPTMNFYQSMRTKPEATATVKAKRKTASKRV